MRKLRTISKTLEQAVGVAVCALAALFVAVLFRTRSESATVPLIFIVVIVIIAARYGTTPGILSSLLSALIFATVMYSPTGELGVAEQTAKQNLGYMLLAGLAASFLLLPMSTSERGGSGKRSGH